MAAAMPSALAASDHDAAIAAPSSGAAGGGNTTVELTRIEGRLEQWIRFGRVAAERFVSRGTRLVSFRPGAVFAFICWTSNDYGTIHSSAAIMTAAMPDAGYSTYPFVRPGGDILLRIEGGQQVQLLLAAIDTIEAAGIDLCDVAPEHWRHVDSRLAAGLPFRPYGRERHAAFWRRRALGS
jgi:hypothetical protein